MNVELKIVRQLSCKRNSKNLVIYKLLIETKQNCENDNHLIRQRLIASAYNGESVVREVTYKTLLPGRVLKSFAIICNHSDASGVIRSHSDSVEIIRTQHTFDDGSFGRS